jgi:sulfur carrier protein ThiS
LKSVLSTAILCHERLFQTKNTHPHALWPLQSTGSRVKITVKLYAVLQIGRFRERELDCPAASKVVDIVNHLDLPSEHVDIMLVNGRHVDGEFLLQDGDILSLLPMVEGG